MKRILLAALAALVPLAAFAAKPAANVPLIAKVHSTVVDQQNTALFFNDPEGCNSPPEIDTPWLVADSAATVSTTAWNFFNWTPTPVSAGVYDSGANCGTGTCLRAEFNSSNKTLTLDTRVTGNPVRTFNVLFDPWDLANDRPGSHYPPWGATLNTTALFEGLASFSMTDMGVCTTAACPEARVIQAKFWFAEPFSPEVTWRLTWNHIRVLRVGPTTWYFLADACDGSQVAGLSRLEGSRTNPRETNRGYFLMPFFIGVDKK